MKTGGSAVSAARILMRPHGKAAFLYSLPKGAAVLDVGCGNNSPMVTKQRRPDLYYVGIDIQDHCQSVAPSRVADEYVLCEPAAFADTIERLGCRFDAVISAHNIEHCLDQTRTIAAMSKVIKPGGSLYMSWPAEHTVRLPSRAGTLNFHDDETHRTLPRFDGIVETLATYGLHPQFKSRAYRPVIPLTIGVFWEPVSRLKRRVGPFQSTWALYGFESVLWCRKQVR